MKKKFVSILVVLLISLVLCSTCFAATFKVERIRIDSSSSQVRALMKNTTNDSLMFVYLPIDLQKEMLATLLSAASADFEMYIGLQNVSGVLYFTYIEPCSLSN